MSDQPSTPHRSEATDLDPTKNKTTAICTETCEIKAPHVSDGHTFRVTTITTETTVTNRTEGQVGTANSEAPVLTAVLVSQPKMHETHLEQPSPLDEQPSCSGYCNSSTKAIVPLSSSLPSKLLRLHAKRSAQALLHQVEQSASLDSQFGSEEGAAGGSEWATNDCADIFDAITPTTATSMSPPPPSTTPVECLEDKLIDVGMGSSIEDSEESEVDDELKPLAVDNHVLQDKDLNTLVERQLSPPAVSSATDNSAVLSEANLEKFRKHHHQMADNIYMHPNFGMENSPPPAVAPANSPTEQRRVHRSFLTMKKPTPLEADVEQANSVISHATSTSIDPDQPLVNEIDTLDPALIPSDELAAEIAEAVEFYFSNESILKDAFLLKHVRRNKEGFVSLKLVSSFKRVRQLTREWKVVGYAVRRKSRKIELNDLGTKVRRLDPLPNFDETMPSRTIVVCDLPLDKLTIEKVSDIFSKCGEIALIRILKPGMAIPVDVRQFMNKYPEMQQKECALVEYQESTSAREAKNLQGPFQVYEMVAPKKKTGKKAIIQVAAPVARMVENYRYYNDASYERSRGGSFSGVMPSHDGDLRYKLKRINSDFQPRTPADYHHSHGQHYQHHQQHSPTHRGSYGSEHMHAFQHYQPRGSFNHDSNAQVASSPSNSFFSYSPRRYSNTSTISANNAALGDSQVCAGATTHASSNSINNNNNNNYNNSINNVSSNPVRRLSNCSDTHSCYNEMSRRPSNCSENLPQRRDSNCSENCPCSRRISDFGQSEVYRKTSQSSICSGERRFSNGSMQFERTFSNASDVGNNNAYTRRMSNDFNYERKPSLEPQSGGGGGVPYEADGNVGGGGGGYNVFPRRYSNNFNASSKLAAYDNAQYINGRRISTDSGYDRRCSFGSEYEGSPRSRTSSFLRDYKNSGGDFDGSPRSRTNSFLDGSPRSRSGSLAQRNAENLVRTPIGPDGSKGFGSRARKFGQTVSPVN